MEVKTKITLEARNCYRKKEHLYPL